MSCFKRMIGPDLYRVFRTRSGRRWGSMMPGQSRVLPTERAVAPVGRVSSIKAVAVALIVIAACGCASAPTTAREGIPNRVVALAPSVTEIVYGLGEGDRLVGACAQCDYPEAAARLPRVGGYLSPSLEAVLGVRPDLVLVVPSPGNREAVRALERAGVRVLVTADRTLDDLWGAITAIA